MRHAACYRGLALLLLTLSGCQPDSGLLDDKSVLTQALSDAVLTTDNGARTGAGGAGTDVLEGDLSGRGTYQLFSIPSVASGEAWRIEGISAGSFTVALFDDDMNLLARTGTISAAPLLHITRRDTPRAYVGVMPAIGAGAGHFRLRVVRQTGQAIPPPRGQVIYLNFAGGQGVRVHTRGATSFPAFDAGVLGPAYEGTTDAVRRAAIATIREDYGPYDVTILSSDEGPPPGDVAYSTVHFGGSDPSLLGLADNVDRYNQDPAQAAMVFVETFGAFASMELSPDEMGLMIGNVGSHELGHMLGLFHTANPDDIMDTTGSAWDLAGAQTFMTVTLEPTVFATGNENSPMILEETVGRRPDAPPLDPPSASPKNSRSKTIRRFAREQLRWSCGLCLNPD